MALSGDPEDAGSVASPYRETEAMADGTGLAARKLARVLTDHPGTGVVRRVDAGYDRTDEVAAERGVRVPMREG